MKNRILIFAFILQVVNTKADLIKLNQERKLNTKII